jgi:hypothetical protein
MPVVKVEEVLKRAVDLIHLVLSELRLFIVAIKDLDEVC